MTAVYRENQMKLTNALCGQSSELYYAEAKPMSLKGLQNQN
jgi:hypothetical protein